MTQMNGQMEPAFRFRSYGGKGELTRLNNLMVSLETKDEKKLGRERRNRKEIDAVL